ncbi:MAG: hypothetical protein KGL39_17100 [Patescibacteria group bacterium]|nr:hypothetical protein [Patescibacteria group bacterium]
MITVVQTDYGDVPEQFRRELAAHQNECLNLFGVQLTSDVRQDFEQKSRHGTGEDGIQWPELTRATIAARVRKRGEGKRIVQRRRELALQIRELTGQRVKLGPSKARLVKRKRNKAKPVSPRHRKKQEKARAAAIKAQSEYWKERSARGDKLSQVNRLRKQRHALLVRLEALIDAGMQNHQIGVDTGLMRSSSSPGFAQGGQIIVGFQMGYAKYFDQKRTLIPEPLPADWMRRLEKKAEDWGTQIIQSVIDRL